MRNSLFIDKKPISIMQTKQQNGIIENLCWLAKTWTEGSKQGEEIYYLYKDIVDEKPNQEELNQAKVGFAILNIITSDGNN